MKQAVLNSETTFEVADNVFPNQIEQEKVILSLKSGQYYGLDEIGARIWDLLQQSQTMGEITRIICREYEVELEECEGDVRELLEELLEAKLIEVQSALS